MGGLARDAEAIEQAGEVGVVAVVHDDEAGIDVMAAVGGVYPDRVGMPAGVGASLIDNDLVLWLE